MGLYRIDPKKGYMGSVDEIDGCQIQMFYHLIGDKITFWLQRPSEHVKYALADIIPRLVFSGLTKEKVIVDWHTMVRYIHGEPSAISAIAEIGLNRIISAMGQYPSKQYATFIMNMIKYIDSEILKKICLVRISNGNVVMNGLVYILYKYEEEVFESEMQRWKAAVVAADRSAAMSWQLADVGEIRYFF